MDSSGGNSISPERRRPNSGDVCGTAVVERHDQRPTSREAKTRARSNSRSSSAINNDRISRIFDELHDRYVYLIVRV